MSAILAMARRPALAAFLALSLHAIAAEPADADKLAEARAIVAAMQVDKQADALSQAMGNAYAREFARMARAQGSHIYDVVLAESTATLKERIRQPGGMADALAQAYATRFTLDELRKIRVFNESPVGQHMLQEMPQIMQGVMQQSIKIGRDSAPQLCGRAKARLAAEGNKEVQAMACPQMP